MIPGSEVRVTYELEHPDAITEACRRLTIMAELWPEEPWRIHIKRTPDPERHRHLWVLYAIVPKGVTP